MTLTCTSRYAGLGAPCQDRQHPDGLHHGHTDSQCLQWADGGVHFSKPIGDCPWPPAHEVAQRAEELGAMIKARRERLTVVAVEHPDDELLHAEIERLRYEETRATDNDFGTHPPHEQLIAGTYTPDWEAIRAAQQHLGAVDPDLIVAVQNLWAQNTARGAEIERLKTELAASRAGTFREAARVLEHTGRDDDAVNLLDIIAVGIEADQES